MWIEAAEIRPDVRGAIHHVIVFVQEPGGRPSEFSGGGNRLTGFAPGEQALLFPAGTAKLVRAGSRYNFQLHYTPNGKEAKDRSYTGLRFAKHRQQSVPLLEMRSMAALRFLPVPMLMK